MLMSFWVNIYLIQFTKMVWSDPDIFNSAGWKPLKPLNSECTLSRRIYRWTIATCTKCISGHIRKNLHKKKLNNGANSDDLSLQNIEKIFNPEHWFLPVTPATGRQELRVGLRRKHFVTALRLPNLVKYWIASFEDGQSSSPGQSPCSHSKTCMFVIEKRIQLRLDYVYFI